MSQSPLYIGNSQFPFIALTPFLQAAISPAPTQLGAPPPHTSSTELIIPSSHLAAFRFNLIDIISGNEGFTGKKIYVCEKIC